MHNAAFRELGLNWRYLAYDVHPEDLPQALKGARAMGFLGLNLTVPHKLLALPLVDELDESARKCGAVNTILFEARVAAGEWKPLAEVEMPRAQRIRLRGFNTDADAVVQSIQEDLEMNLAGKRVLILGAGGAGRVAALKLASAGVAELFLVNRSEEKSRAILQEIRQLVPALKTNLGYPPGQVDLLLNATSLGLKADDPLPVSESNFSLSQALAVYDMIYRPAKTRLLERAEKAGCRIANGLGMLLYQGAKALEIWTGKIAPIELMRSALEKNIYG